MTTTMIIPMIVFVVLFIFILCSIHNDVRVSHSFQTKHLFLAETVGFGRYTTSIPIGFLFRKLIKISIGLRIASRFHKNESYAQSPFSRSLKRRQWDSNPRGPCEPNTLARCRFRPLSHVSICAKRIIGEAECSTSRPPIPCLTKLGIGNFLLRKNRMKYGAVRISSTQPCLQYQMKLAQNLTFS